MYTISLLKPLCFTIVFECLKKFWVYFYKVFGKLFIQHTLHPCIKEHSFCGKFWQCQQSVQDSWCCILYCFHLKTHRQNQFMQLWSSMWSCQKSDLGRDNKTFLNCPALPCQCFKVYLDHLEVRKEEQTHTREKPYSCIYLVSTLDITVVFSNKKKLLFLLLFITVLKEVNELPWSLRTSDGEHWVVLSILKYWSIVYCVWQILLVEIILCSLDFFCHFCSSCALLSDWCVSAVMYTIGYPSSKWSIFYLKIRQYVIILFQ